MDFYSLYNDFAENANSMQSQKMSAYMRNLFPFLGIPTPKRRSLCKSYFKQAKSENIVDWSFINKCWDCEYRELQYVAMDYLSYMKEYLTDKDIPRLKELIVNKSWWDSIDGLDRVVGEIALRYPIVNDIMIEWSLDDNIWLRRTAIDHQLLRKHTTNIELLEQIIINNLGSKEFFINKAIGWILRDYSKTNPEWVSNFIDKHRDKMSSLSIKEGSKYL